MLCIFSQIVPLFMSLKKEGTLYYRSTCKHGVAACFINSYSGLDHVSKFFETRDYIVIKLPSCSFQQFLRLCWKLKEVCSVLVNSIQYFCLPQYNSLEDFLITSNIIASWVTCGFHRTVDVTGGCWNIKSAEWQFFLAISTTMLPSSLGHYSRTTLNMQTAKSFEASITNYQ
jgi:hypothetical protein